MVGGKLGTVWCLVFSVQMQLIINCFTPPPSNVLYSYETSSVRVKGCRSWAFVRRLWPLSLCFFLAAPAATLGFCGVFFMSFEGVPNLSSRMTSMQGVLWTYQYPASYRMYPEDHCQQECIDSEIL